MCIDVCETVGLVGVEWVGGVGVGGGGVCVKQCCKVLCSSYCGIIIILTFCFYPISGTLSSCLKFPLVLDQLVCSR